MSKCVSHITYFKLYYKEFRDVSHSLSHFLSRTTFYNGSEKGKNESEKGNNESEKSTHGRAPNTKTEVRNERS